MPATETRLRGRGVSAIVAHARAGRPAARHPVGGLLHFAQDMRTHQHRVAAGQRADQVAHLDDLARIEPVGRLVEDQECRDRAPAPARARCAGDSRATACGIGLSSTSDEREPVDDLVAPRAPRCAAGTPRSRAMKARNSPTRMWPVERRRFRHIADALRAPASGSRMHVEAADREPPGGRQQKARQQPHERGLAGAVGPQQAEHLAAPDLEVEPVERGDRAVALAHGTCAHRGALTAGRDA